MPRGRSQTPSKGKVSGVSKSPGRAPRGKAAAVAAAPQPPITAAAPLALGVPPAPAAEDELEPWNSYFGKYISKQGAVNLHHYKYKGSDASYFYNCVANPFIYPVLLDVIPLWMAPNLITFLGLLCTITSYLVMNYYCPELEGTAPWWAYVLNAVLLFSYQCLDAVDGKQARRTGTSSPLGLLFDHGCDAVNTTISCLTLLMTIQMGATWLSFGLWAVSVVSFYAATWEEYYTGELALPVINGPNEGILITCSMHLFTAAVGPAFWLVETAFFGVTLQRNAWFLCLVILLALPTIGSNVGNVFRAVQRDDKFSLAVAMTRMLPFCFVVGSAFVWVYFSPADIMQRHPQLVIWALALLFSKLVTHLMIAHLCEEEYHPFGKTMALFVFIGLHAGSSLFKWFKIDEEFIGYSLNEEFLLYEFFAISAFAYAHLVFCVVWEVTTILGIKCFTIPHGDKKNQASSAKKAKSKKKL